MRIDIVTLFPELCDGFLSTSILGRARAKNLFEAHCHQIRDYTKNKQRQTDDYPYGGGCGMVLYAQPIADCLRAVADQCAQQGRAKPHVVFLTAAGQPYNEETARRLSSYESLALVCGHYEGIDERALELIQAEYLSAGDFVLTGGELPSMVMIDCISRLVPGVLGNGDSAEVESFYDNLLEYPQYTRPEVYEGKPVPEVLLSGHHKNIESWRREQSIRRTLERRPDLLEDASLTLKEQKFLDSLLKEQGESRLKELEQLVREAVKSDETPGSDREYYQQMKKVKKLLNEKKATLQELKGYYKVLGALKQEI